MSDTISKSKDKGPEFEGSFPGVYRATVIDRKDPDKQHRIKVSCPQVYGGIPKEDLPWCYPCLPAWQDVSAQYGGGGMGYSPPEGAPVMLMFEAGNSSYPIWFGGWWGKRGEEIQTPIHAYTEPEELDVGAFNEEGGTEGTGGAGTPTSTDSEGVPDNFWFTTPRGTTIQIDEREGIEKFLVRLPEGHYIVLQKGGLAETNAETVSLKSKGKTIIQSDDVIEIKCSKDAFIYSAGNVVIEAAEQVSVNSNNSVNIMGARINLNPPEGSYTYKGEQIKFINTEDSPDTDGK